VVIIKVAEETTKAEVMEEDLEAVEKVEVMVATEVAKVEDFNQDLRYSKEKLENPLIYFLITSSFL